jgi:hypothetical protein
VPEYDYVEDPIGRIVAVHWDDSGGTGGPLPKRCGSYSWGYENTGHYSPTGPNRDPWLVLNPDDEWYGNLVNGIGFGFGFIQLGRTRIDAFGSSKFRLDIFYTVSNPEHTYGIGISHIGGPPNPDNEYGFWYPSIPLVTFQGSVSWEYDALPDSGLMFGAYGDFETGRFDPAYGGGVDVWPVPVDWGDTGLLQPEFGFMRYEPGPYGGEILTYTVTAVCEGGPSEGLLVQYDDDPGNWVPV